MTTMNADRLVDDYLRRLNVAAAGLPQSRRSELLAEIRAHIEEALRDIGKQDEVAVRNVLERLGPPDEIAGAADEASEVSGSASSTPARHGHTSVLRFLAAAVLAIVVLLTGVAALASGLGPLERGLLLAVGGAALLLMWRLSSAASWLRLSLNLELAALLALVACVVLTAIGVQPLLVWIPAASLVLLSRRWSARDKLVTLLALPSLAGLLVWSTTSAHLRTGGEWILGLAVSAPFAAGYLAWRIRTAPSPG